MGLQRVGHDWSDLAHRHPKLIKVKINPSKKENSGKISLVVIGKKIQNNNKTKKFLKSTYFCKPSFKQEIRLTIGHLIWNIVQKERGFPGDSDSKESACNAGDLGSIPWSGRSPGEENGNPLQYCLYGCKESNTSEWLTHTCIHAKLLQLFLTLCDPMDYSLQGSSVCRILQAGLLERVAMPSSRGSSWPRDGTCISYVSCIGRQVLYC